MDVDKLHDDTSLIGEGVQQAESNISEKLDYVDDRIDEGKQKIEAEKQRIGAEIEERKEQFKEAVIQKISPDNKNTDEKEDE